MKQLIILIILFVCLKLSAQKQVNETGVVIAHMKAQEESWNKGNIPGFMDYYWKSDSLKFIGSKGITYGWQKTLDNYLKSYPDKATMGSLKFTIIEAIQLSDTSIYVIGKWELSREKAVGGHFTLLWKKINGKWVIVADHTS